MNNLHLNVKKTKLLLVSTHSKLLRLGEVEPVILYDRPVALVKQYNYLGVILDSEITLKPFFNHVKKIIYAKVFSFQKICMCLTENAAIMVYKHTILPFLEYAGFILTACSMEDRRDLQKYQNEALGICTRVRLTDHVRIEDLHTRCKIVSLEQRRRMQLLMFMYKKSKDVTMHKVFISDTRISKLMSLRQTPMRELFISRVLIS